jgi:hypothetical protein
VLRKIFDKTLEAIGITIGILWLGMIMFAPILFFILALRAFGG